MKRKKYQLVVAILMFMLAGCNLGQQVREGPGIDALSDWQIVRDLVVCGIEQSEQKEILTSHLAAYDTALENRDRGALEVSAVRWPELRQQAERCIEGRLATGEYGGAVAAFWLRVVDEYDLTLRKVVSQ